MPSCSAVTATGLSPSSAICAPPAGLLPATAARWWCGRKPCAPLAPPRRIRGGDGRGAIRAWGGEEGARGQSWPEGGSRSRRWRSAAAVGRLMGRRGCDGACVGLRRAARGGDGHLIAPPAAKGRQLRQVALHLELAPTRSSTTLHHLGACYGERLSACCAGCGTRPVTLGGAAASLLRSGSSAITAARCAAKNCVARKGAARSCPRDLDSTYKYRGVGTGGPPRSRTAPGGARTDGRTGTDARGHRQPPLLPRRSLRVRVDPVDLLELHRLPALGALLLRLDRALDAALAEEVPAARGGARAASAAAPAPP
jgi:hypothetical protein